MALIIHKVLFEKLCTHPEWVKFEESFRNLCGIGVRLEAAPSEREELQIAAKIDVRGVLVGVLVAEGRKLGPGQARACRHLLGMAAEHFSSLLSSGNAPDHEGLPKVILRTCDWIRSHALEQEVRLAEAAAASGLSAGHLSRLFHQSTGLTFQEYVRRFRLERACELLTATNRPITEIAFDSGFQSISQFHRSFRAVYGEPPLVYRKKHT